MNKNKIEQSLKKWNLSLDFFNNLNNNEKEFVIHEFTGIRSPENYQKRLEYLGFTRMDKVLDAGCGMGQWSLVLAQNNKEVYATDINKTRTKIAEKLMSNNDIKNCNIHNHSLEKLPIPDSSLDGIICYSVIMFTHIPNTLKEFHRVLKDDGKLYIMTDLQGWQKILLKRSLKNIKPVVLFYIRKILGFKKNIPYSKNWFLKQMTKAGFDNVLSFEEGGGTFLKDPSGKEKVLFYESYLGNTQTLADVIAIKKN